MKKILKYKAQALTLTELLVVMVIVGILTMLALPKITGLIGDAHEIEAKKNLEFLYQLEQRHFMEFAKYNTSLEAIRFEQNKLVSEGGQAHYEITIEEASQSTFRAKATSITDFDGDGVFNVWQIDQDKNLERVIGD